MRASSRRRAGWLLRLLRILHRFVRCLLPFVLENAIEFHVLELVPLFDVPPARAFVLHAKLSNDPARSGIAREVGAMDSNQTQFRKRIAQNSFTRFGAEALVPIWPANPVTQFRLMARFQSHQANRPDQRAACLLRDGKRNAFALIELGLVL